MTDERSRPAPGVAEESFRGSIPLSSIEQFHLYDSSEEFPNAITGKFHFRGTLNRELALEAWRVMLKRQRIGMWPIVEKSSGLVFEPDRETEQSANEIIESTFHWQDVANWPNDERDFDLTQTNDAGIPMLDMLDSTGYGIWCLVGDGVVTIVLSVHHAYTDGPGGVIIIRDWMTIYHNLVNGRPSTKGLGRLDFSKWRVRNKLGLLSWNYLKTLPMQWIALFGAAKFVFRKFVHFLPQHSVNENGNAEEKVGFPGIAACWLSAESLAHLDALADDYGCSLNSLLMIRLLRTINGWENCLSERNSRCVNETLGSKWTRVILPISIRGLSDRHLPAANKATIVQIDRCDKDIVDERQAARMLDREVKIIVGFNLERIFLIVVRLFSIRPGWLKWLARQEQPRGSVIFTNLGAPLRKTRACDFRTVGDLNLVDFDLCGPIRSGTPINVAFQRHDDRARLTLHFDRRCFSHALAEELLALLAAEFSQQS